MIAPLIQVNKQQPVHIRVFLQLFGTSRQEVVPYDFLLFVFHTKAILSSHLWCMLDGVFEFE